MRIKRPVLFVLLDGLGDYSTPEARSLLEGSRYPSLNLLAKFGVNGLFDPVQAGLACGSDTAHMSLLGYNPFTQYKGRGAYETMGAGLTLGQEDIGFKCNFAFMDQTGVVRKRRVDREFPQWGIPLVEWLNNRKLKEHPEHSMAVQYANEHRVGIRIAGPNLSSFVSGTDPLKDNLPLRKSKPLRPGFKEQLTADIINQASALITQLLEQHPINLQRKALGLPHTNVVLFRGAGQPANLMSFEERWGVKGAMIAPTKLVRGLGLNAGMRIVDVEGATGDYHSNYKAKFKAAIQLMVQGVPFVFVHIKSVDQACHDRNLTKKEQMLHKVDQALAWLFRELPSKLEDCLIAVTSDHSSPVAFGQHTYQPVPIAVSSMRNLAGQGEVSSPVDEVQQFSELSCGEGLLGRTQGANLLQWLLETA